jgi:hypothetical protein
MFYVNRLILRIFLVLAIMLFIPKIFANEQCIDLFIDNQTSTMSEALFSSSSGLKRLSDFEIFGDHSESDPIHRAGYVTGKKGVKVPLYTAISKANFGEIFKHSLDVDHPDTLIAKAVAISIDPRSGRTPTIYFFPTGMRHQSYNVHHRDALSVALEMESLRDFASDEFYRELINRHAAENQIPPDVTAKALRALESFASTRAMITSFFIPDGFPAEIKERRTGSDLDPQKFETINRAQGYQLQAQKRNGQWKIVGLQLDSSITSYQRRAPIPPSFEFQQYLLAEVQKRIEANVIGFNQVEVPSGFRWLEDYKQNADGSFNMPSGGIYVGPFGLNKLPVRSSPKK